MLNGDGTTEKEHCREGLQEMLAKVWGVKWALKRQHARSTDPKEVRVRYRAIWGKVFQKDGRNRRCKRPTTGKT